MTTNNPKLLVATGIFPPSVGGPATYSKLLLDELPKRGVEVRVVSFDDVRSYPKGIRHLLYFWKLLRNSRGVTHIYAQDPVSVGLPALCASFLARKKFFIRVAGDYAWEQSTQRYEVTDSIDQFQEKTYDSRVERLRKIQRFVVSHADKVITPSEYFKKLVSKWSPETPIVAIYNGISFPEKKGKKEHDMFSVVSAGRLVPWKGFKELIGVVAELNKEGEHVQLTILGDGPQRKELETTIKELEAGEYVVLTGSLSRDDMFEYLYNTDVFVLNTSFESFSFQVIEAMYAGLPVVTNNVGSLPELVREGKEGFLCSVGDVECLKRRIIELKNDDALRRDMGKNGESRSQEFSIEKTLERLVNEL